MLAYRVVSDNKACSHCGNGGTFTVIGPNNVAIGTSFSDETDASETASMLNAAFELGMQQQKKTVSIDDFLRLYDVAHGVVDEIRMHIDHAEYEGGMNAVNLFREVATDLRWKYADITPDPLTGSTNEDEDDKV